MRHEFAAEARVFGFREDDRRARLGPRGDTIERLSPGAALIVIAVLSALSWAVLIALAIGISSLV